MAYNLPLTEFTFLLVCAILSIFIVSGGIDVHVFECHISIITLFSTYTVSCQDDEKDVDLKMTSTECCGS